MESTSVPEAEMSTAGAIMAPRTSLAVKVALMGLSGRSRPEPDGVGHVLLEDAHNVLADRGGVRAFGLKVLEAEA